MYEYCQLTNETAAGYDLSLLPTNVYLVQQIFCIRAPRKPNNDGHERKTKMLTPPPEIYTYVEEATVVSALTMWPVKDSHT